jgi:hypothetical protein
LPITFSFDEDSGRFLTFATGMLLPSHPVEHLKEVMDHPCFDQGLSALVICRDVSLDYFRPREIMELVRFTRSVEAQIRDAKVAVVTDQPVAYRLLKLYDRYQDPLFSFSVFPEEQEAVAWLDSLS